MTRAPLRAAVRAAASPAGPDADDQHVAEGEGLFVMVGIGFAGGAAQSRRAADQRLVKPLPEGRRPHEGLVVEAGRKDRREQRIERQKVEAQRRPAILARSFETFEQLDVVVARLLGSRRAPVRNSTSALGSSGPAVMMPRGR